MLLVPQCYTPLQKDRVFKLKKSIKFRLLVALEKCKRDQLDNIFDILVMDLYWFYLLL